MPRSAGRGSSLGLSVGRRHVLRPLEVADGHTTCVGEDVRHDAVYRRLADAVGDEGNDHQGDEGDANRFASMKPIGCSPCQPYRREVGGVAQGRAALQANTGESPPGTFCSQSRNPAPVSACARRFRRFCAGCWTPALGVLALLLSLRVSIGVALFCPMV
jgi:hypothetical protein